MKTSWGRKGFAVLATALLIAGLQGCATRLDTTVTAFHEPDLAWKGKRFVIVADERQRDSLEFKAYADLVSQALQRNGLVPIVATNRADIDVKLQYKVDELRSTRYDSPAYYGSYGFYGGYGFWGPGAYWGRPYRRGWGPSYYGFYGPGPYWAVPMYYPAQPRVYSSWRHELKVDLGQPGVEKQQFEATASTENNSSSQANVMPALVEAIFHDFPGPSGQSRQVEVELREPAQSSSSQLPSK